MSALLRRSVFVFGFGLTNFLAVTSGAAQTDYSLAFEPGGTLWEVEVRMPGRGEETIDFWIPLWTPGAYHVSEYGRFVKEFTAQDGQGTALVVERIDNAHFVLRGVSGAKEIVIHYQAEPISTGIFTHNVIDVEANRIARDYAYVNPVSLFGFVPARSDEEIRLAIALPDRWKVATALHQDAQGRFHAPSYYRFEDSPLLFSPTLETSSFEVDGKPHRVVVHGKNAADTSAIAAGCKRIVEAASALLGGLPYDHYDFLYGFADEAGGSGLEHSFSTLILVNSSTSIAEDARTFWGVTAHEFFHLWCAERIHVEGIHRPDYTQPFETGTIWVNEGITEYFSRHLLLHAGFYDQQQFLATYFENRPPPGAMPKATWTDVSRRASSWGGMEDLMQFALRMYLVGPRTIFALDMTMRAETDGERGVLDLLHYLITNYVQKDRGFGEEELDEILAVVAGPSATGFYERYVAGDEIPDPAEFLNVIGYAADKRQVRPLENPTDAQLKARKDFFSISGRP